MPMLRRLLQIGPLFAVVLAALGLMYLVPVSRGMRYKLSVQNGYLPKNRFVRQLGFGYQMPRIHMTVSVPLRILSQARWQRNRSIYWVVRRCCSHCKPWTHSALRVMLWKQSWIVPFGNLNPEYADAKRLQSFPSLKLVQKWLVNLQRVEGNATAGGRASRMTLRSFKEKDESHTAQNTPTQKRKHFRCGSFRHSVHGYAESYRTFHRNWTYRL